MNIECKQCRKKYTEMQCSKCKEPCCWACVHPLMPYLLKYFCNDCVIPFILLEKINE